MRGVIRIFLVLIIGVAAVLAVLVTIFVLGDSKDLAVSFARGDDGRVVTLADGDRFDVALPGNPSTGYTWVAVVNESVVRQVGDIDFTADSDLIGAAGTMVLHFECVGPGTTEVSLEYIRPFEPNEPAADMFSVSITVAN